MYEGCLSWVYKELEYVLGLWGGKERGGDGRVLRGIDTTD